MGQGETGDIKHFVGYSAPVHLQQSPWGGKYQRSREEPERSEEQIGRQTRT